MIEFKNVTKSYKMGNQQYNALKGIDIQIEQGEFVAIIGPSGSGKTTTMNILGLLDRPTSGSYYLEGIETSTFDMDKLADLRNEKLGFIFQSFFLLPKMTALQNVLLPLTYRRRNSQSHLDSQKEKDHQKALEILAKVGMSNHVNHRPNELSGGQQQRVAIARALVGQPALVLADEPTGSLDIKTGNDVLELLNELNRTEKTTIVIITHDQEIARRCRRVIQIYDGNIKE